MFRATMFWSTPGPYTYPPLLRPVATGPEAAQCGTAQRTDTEVSASGRKRRQAPGASSVKASLLREDEEGSHSGSSYDLLRFGLLDAPGSPYLTRYLDPEWIAVA